MSDALMPDVLGEEKHSNAILNGSIFLLLLIIFFLKSFCTNAKGGGRGLQYNWEGQ